VGGYGYFGFDGRIQLAHRVSYLINIGDIPEGYCVCHKCDNPSCVRPEHLFVGTQTDNIADMVSKKRLCRGSGKKESKLTECEVLEIRSRYSNGVVSQKYLADKYGVNASVISRIVNNKAWFHVK
jgi:hypothetical protein